MKRRKARTPFTKRRRAGLALTVGLTMLGMSLISFSFTDSVAIADSGVSDLVGADPITAENIKPDECSGITLGLIHGGGEPAQGDSTSELVVADDTTINMDGGDGDDCIIGGSHTTWITGGPGNDVCIADNIAYIDTSTCEVPVVRP